MKGMNNMTTTDKIEMVADAKSYLRSLDIKPTSHNVIEQIAAEHGRSVANQIADHLRTVEAHRFNARHAGSKMTRKGVPMIMTTDGVWTREEAR
jgi:rRNA maturation protein Rpf1